MTCAGAECAKAAHTNKRASAAKYGPELVSVDMRGGGGKRVANKRTGVAHVEGGWKKKSFSEPRNKKCGEIKKLVRVSGFGFRVSGFGFRVSGFGSRVSGLGRGLVGRNSFAVEVYARAVRMIVSHMPIFFNSLTCDDNVLVQKAMVPSEHSPHSEYFLR